MRIKILIIFVMLLLTENSWSKDFKSSLCNDSGIVQMDTILSYLRDSDMVSLKNYCDGDIIKMVDTLYFYSQFLNRDSMYWYNEYNCDRSFIGVPMTYKEAIKCVSYKLKAYYWMLKISNGLIEENDKYICVFYDKKKAIYDQFLYYDCTKSKFVFVKIENRKLDKIFRNWYKSVKRNGIVKAQKDFKKVSYKIKLNGCR